MYHMCRTTSVRHMYIIHMYITCVLHMHLLRMLYTYILTHVIEVKYHTCITGVAQLAMYHKIMTTRTLLVFLRFHCLEKTEIKV